DFVTTAPAATTAPVPTRTPLRITACAPIQTSSSKTIGALIPRCSRIAVPDSDPLGDVELRPCSHKGMCADGNAWAGTEILHQLKRNSVLNIAPLSNRNSVRLRHTNGSE